MLDWLIARGYTPANWRPATLEELRFGYGRENGMILVSHGDRATIAAAMARPEVPAGAKKSR